MRKVRKLVFIVATDHKALFESLRRTFAADDAVDVIMDRRVAERRRASPTDGPDRRRQDRRSAKEIQRRLKARGYAVVTILAVKS